MLRNGAARPQGRDAVRAGRQLSCMPGNVAPCQDSQYVRTVYHAMGDVAATIVVTGWPQWR